MPAVERFLTGAELRTVALVLLVQINDLVEEGTQR